MVTDYRLTDGTKEITAWRGTTVNGLYVEDTTRRIEYPNININPMLSKA